MGTDTKNIARVGGGFSGKKQPQKSIIFKTHLIAANDNTGPGADLKIHPNFVNTVQRKETTDQQKRRTQGYRGL